MTFKTVLLSASLAALLLGCSGASHDDGDISTLHRGNGAEPLSLDPHLASGKWENTIIGDMFLGLYTEKPDGTPTYGLASSHSVSEDGLTWTFGLRDADWSDGTKITAHDFVFALRRIVNPETLAQYAFILYPIAGAEDINNGRAAVDTLGVHAVDDMTLEIKLVSPTPFLPGLLTHFTAYALPTHVVEQHGNDWIKPENIVVSGPYKLAQWRTNDFVRVEKNSAFFDADNVCLSEVFYYPTNDSNTALRRVQTGELHLNTDVPGKKIDYYKDLLPGYVRVHPFLVSSYLTFNGSEPPFDNADVRNALSMAIDRDYIVDEVIQGGRVPSTSFVPPGIDNYDTGAPWPKASWADKPLDERRAMARSLLEGAGFGRDKPFNFEFSHRNTGDNPLSAPVIQESWNAIAPWVSATLQSVETQIHYDNLRTGNFQVGDGGWVADYNDPQNFLFLLETRTGQMNYGRYSNAEFDELLARSSKILDVTERAKVLATAEKMVLDDSPVAPTWFGSSRNIVNPRVTGWVDNVVDLHRSRYLCLTPKP